MKKEILFCERQKFNQWWLWLILLGVNGMFLFGVYKQVVGGQAFGDNSMSDTGLLIVTGLLILTTILFLNFRLDTHVKSDGIYVRFFPFHFRYRFYSWDLISKCYVRKYSAIIEYGGWGLRIGLFGKGTAFNVSGNKGLQLEFKTGRKLLIGTKKSEELAAVLTKLGQIKE